MIALIEHDGMLPSITAALSPCSPTHRAASSPSLMRAACSTRVCGRPTASSSRCRRPTRSSRSMNNSSSPSRKWMIALHYRPVI